jgi:hypothetical protein
LSGILRSADWQTVTGVSKEHSLLSGASGTKKGMGLLDPEK